MFVKVIQRLIPTIFALTLTSLAQANESAAENCVYARDVQQFEILDDETILLHGKFDRYWVNRLNARCAGLRKNMVVQLDRYGSQMCANDRFTVQSRGALIGEGPTANCRLGPFEEVAAAQVVALKASLRDS